MGRTDETAGSEAFKRLLQQLGTTIERTLSQSPQISECLDRMRAEGYEVSLELDATIGLSRTGRDTSDVAGLLAPPETAPVEKAWTENGPQERVRGEMTPIAEPPLLRMTPLDRKFLRSLKIAVED